MRTAYLLVVRCYCNGNIYMRGNYLRWNEAQKAFLRLLQKVKELRLYLIDQQKQLKGQQEQITLLQKQNEVLLKRMEDKR